MFITVAGTPPFTEATLTEFYYKLIKGLKWETFWKYHLKGKPVPFSEEFKTLMQSMLHYEPTERLTIDQIKAHSWYRGSLPSY